MKLKQFNKRLGDGAWLGVPMQTYQDYEAMSSTRLRVLLESPLKFKRMSDGIGKRTSSDAMGYGTAGHGIILEGSIESFHVHPENQSNGKPWTKAANECKDWHAAHTDKPCLSFSQANQLMQDREYVRNHPKAKGLLEGAQVEVSFLSIATKARADVFQMRKDECEVSDLKIVRDASDAAMSKMILDYGYHIQFAWYRQVIKACGFNPIRFNIIALQKDDTGPLVNVIEVSNAALALGDKEIERAEALLARCEANKFWPEWPDYDGTNTIKVIDVPAWAYPNTETELTFGGEQIAV